MASTDNTEHHLSAAPPSVHPNVFADTSPDSSSHSTSAPLDAHANHNVPASLDTSILVRIITGDPPSEAKRASALTEDKNKKFFIADLAFFEAVYVLQKVYAWPRKAIATALAAMFIDRSNIECNRNLLYQVLEDYVTHPKLSFGDCYLAWKTRVNDKTPLWTFDRKLAEQLQGTELLA